MKIKCGKKEYYLTPSDRIVYDGATYQLITRTIQKGKQTVTPVVAKVTADRLIQERALVLAKKEKRDGVELLYYKLAT